MSSAANEAATSLPQRSGAMCWLGSRGASASSGGRGTMPKQGEQGERQRTTPCLRRPRQGTGQRDYMDLAVFLPSFYQHLIIILERYIQQS
jgi:hypothetical protein